MAIFIEYTKEQKQAIAQLRRAFTRCKKVRLAHHNCYGRLRFYPIKELSFNYDVKEEDTIDEHEIEFEGIRIEPEWSDDTHYFKLTIYGKNKYMKEVE